MTRRQWLLGASIAALAIAASYAYQVTPAVGTRVPVPMTQLDRFAACLPLTAAEVTTIRETRHYRVAAPVRDTLGKAVPGHYVWAVDTIPGLWEHEWMHLVLPGGDDDHNHPRWAAARRCGAV